MDKLTVSRAVTRALIEEGAAYLCIRVLQNTNIITTHPPRNCRLSAVVTTLTVRALRAKIVDKHSNSSCRDWLFKDCMVISIGKRFFSSIVLKQIQV